MNALCRLTVILPSLNEPHVETLTEEIHGLFSNVEVLVQSELGISYAVWSGLQKASGEYVAVMDADGSHNPRYLMPMLEQLERCDVAVVVANRVWNQYPLHRKVLSLACAWLTRHWLGLKLQDPLPAFVVGKKEAMQFKPIRGCKFALEIIMQNKRIVEYPIVHDPLPDHKSKMKPMEGIHLLRQLWRLKKWKLQNHT